MKNLKIIGITISLSWIALLTLAIFLKALGILLDDFFVNNSLIITIVSGILVLVLIIIGAISLKALTSGSRGLFG